MSAVFIAIILTAVVVLASAAMLVLHNRKKRQKEARMLQRFSWLGSEHALSFSSQDRLKNTIMGLDGIHGSLLIMRHDKDGNKTGSKVIDLTNVQRCILQKTYDKNNLQSATKEHASLEKVSLLFETVDKATEEVIFYHHANNDRYEATMLEKKAAHWETMLNKMLPTKVKKIA